MATTRFIWNGEAAKVKVRENVAARINKTGRSLQNFIRKKLSTVHPSARRGRKKRGRVQRQRRGGGSKRKLRNTGRGRYPSLRTGNLRRNIIAEHDRSIPESRVGTNVLYGKFLELNMGFTWLSRGVREHFPVMRNIMSRGKVL